MIEGAGWLLPVHAAATWYMTGVIWFVQLVHYPLMDGVGAERFAAYEARHTRWTGWVVAPAMLVEGATAVALVALGDTRVEPRQAWAGLVLVAIVWISTALLQVPQHRRLERGFDPRAHATLVRSNWVRVVAWSARALLVGFWV